MNGVSIMDMKSKWSGLRPLVYDVSGNDGNSAKLARTHVIE